MLNSCTIRLTKSRINAGYLAIPTSFRGMFPSTEKEVAIVDVGGTNPQRFTPIKSTAKEARIYGMRSLYDRHCVKPGDVVCVRRLNGEGFDYQISVVEQRSLTTTEESRSSEEPLPDACDKSEPPRRVRAEVSRIVRDTTTAKRLKRKYDWQCQVCGQQLLCWHGRFYIEVHHLRPLGMPHNGLDRFNNMLVVCPNHHALFDLGVPQFLSDAHIEISGHGYELRTDLETTVAWNRVLLYRAAFLVWKGVLGWPQPCVPDLMSRPGSG